jgi:hypothetical protein
VSSYGVRCTLASGEDILVTVDATDAESARGQLVRHRNLFYGPGDAAGRWLASQNPERTITQVHEAKPIGEWS